MSKPTIKSMINKWARKQAEKLSVKYYDCKYAELPDEVKAVIDVWVERSMLPESNKMYLPL